VDAKGQKGWCQSVRPRLSVLRSVSLAFLSPLTLYPPLTQVSAAPAAVVTNTVPTALGSTLQWSL
jgi:hypothetical protein